MSKRETAPTVMDLTAEIVSAYVSHNPIPSADLSSLVGAVHAALTGAPHGQAHKPQDELSPAVPVKKSVRPDYIVCLEDGRKFKSLKRHLGKLGLTPEKYREKWGLPSDYPMVAASYTRKRSEIAKGMGLGRRMEVEVVDERKRARARRTKEVA